MTKPPPIPPGGGFVVSHVRCLATGSRRSPPWGFRTGVSWGARSVQAADHISEVVTMPELATEQVTKHTLTLTDDELTAVRRAAAIALDQFSDMECADTWRALSQLGKPPTRSEADGT